jgi:putative glutathione S-transferase
MARPERSLDFHPDLPQIRPRSSSLPPVAPPPWLVSGARAAWHWQWLQLMAGLGPADAAGRYQRPEGAFPACPPPPADAETAGNHVLIVGRSCPWAHRAWLVWTLRQLGGSIELVPVEPDPAAGRWRFSTPFEGCTTLLELYRRSGAGPSRRATVPVLYSRSQGKVLVGESARLIELLNRWPAGGGTMDLEPAAQQATTLTWRESLQHSVNDGVYRCGFARNQGAYDAAEAALFETLDQAEAALGRSPWLSGTEPSLADVQLFPTLIRLELVYAPLFGVSRRPLWQLPALWAWRRRFHQLPGVAATCNPEAWRRDYFGALFPLHPSGIVPAGPALATLVGPCPGEHGDGRSNSPARPPGEL